MQVKICRPKCNSIEKQRQYEQAIRTHGMKAKSITNLDSDFCDFWKPSCTSFEYPKEVNEFRGSNKTASTLAYERQRTVLPSNSNRTLFWRCAVNVKALSTSCKKISMRLAACIIQGNINLGKFPVWIEISGMLREDSTWKFGIKNSGFRFLHHLKQLGSKFEPDWLTDRQVNWISHWGNSLINQKISDSQNNNSSLLGNRRVHRRQHKIFLSNPVLCEFHSVYSTFL